MRATLRCVCVLVVVLVTTVGSSELARAAVTNATGTNVQDGDNRDTTRQRGAGTSGDAVGGQVAGVVSGGRTSVDARNTSRDSSVESGEVKGSNTSRSFTGLNALSGGDATNLQTGDNRSTLSQSADASSGDAVGGQVIGAVTAPGGSSSIVADNLSENVDVTTGDAESTNTADGFVGLNVFAFESATNIESAPRDPSISADLFAVATASAANTQEGDNRATLRQSAPSSTGDGVAGQVIGAVTGGASSIDARNTSRDSSVQTGDATSANTADLFVGLNAAASSSAVNDFSVDQDNISCDIVINQSECGDIAQSNAATVTATLTAVSTATATNTQDGDNRATLSQSAPASSGDGVAGQVIGAVTAGGSSSIVAANTSDGVDVNTGVAKSNNTTDVFVGLDADASSAAANNLSVTQSNEACLTVDDAECEEIFQSNVATVTATLTAVSAADAVNDHTGDNRASLSQSAPASTGDGVAGQVIGAVTSGGASSIDARNTSHDSSVDTGDATSGNTADVFVGLDADATSAAANNLSVTQSNEACLTVTSGAECQEISQTNTATVAATLTAVSASTPINTQDGDNRTSLSQSAPASSGDAVAGEVIGAVTSGGASSIVAANTSDGVDVTTGDAHSTNAADVFVGLDADATSAAANDLTFDQENVACFTVSGTGTLCAAEEDAEEALPISQTNTATLTADLSAVSAAAPTNTQDGDNRASLSQSAPASTGDGVAGQVIGAVTSGGASSIDASNTSRDSSVDTGDATSANTANVFAGLDADARSAAANNLAFDQENVACSTVAGTETLCAAETEEEGEALGVFQTNTATITADLSAVSTSAPTNSQDGDNRATLSQAAPASSGDGVAGEVIGAVTSGGASSIVAANTSDGVDVNTGDANSSNAAGVFVGLDADATSAAANDLSLAQDNTACETVLGGAFCSVEEDDEDEPPINQTNTATIAATLTAASVAGAVNDQTGDNRATLSQSAPASTGDGVAGQVIGAVTSSGASSIDARNTSRDSSVETGDATSANTANVVVGLDADAVSSVANDLSVTQDNEACLTVDDAECATIFQTNTATVAATLTAVSTSTPINTQDGDNRATLSQSAPASTGDGVTGEVIGAVTSGGASSIVAANTSDGVDVTTGDAKSNNTADVFVGLDADATSAAANNLLVSQSNVACVTVDDAECEEILQSNVATVTATLTAVSVADAVNDHEGDNRATLSQSAPASTGDGVAGQVIGAVTSGGASSIDATNTSRDSSVDTGDATSANTANVFVGLDADATSAAANNLSATQSNNACLTVLDDAECEDILQANAATVTATLTAVSTSTPINTQEGDNRATLSQSAPASTGDGVAGEVIGAVTSGGASSIVAANTSDGVDVDTGDAHSTNDADVFVGLDAQATSRAINDVFVAQSNDACLIVIDPGCEEVTQSNASTTAVFAFSFASAEASNFQVGDNRLTLGQTATASTGDGVAGQVIGAVTSGGATSIDATNTSRDSSVETGDANASNGATEFVGLRAIDVETGDGGRGVVGEADISGVSADNVQEGDNRRSFHQTAEAVSGDAVAGQVTGVVTSAGGATSVVVANTSEGIDATSGESDFTNADDAFVGLLATSIEFGGIRG